MKTIAIIASILVSVGYPAYDDLVAKAQRNDAKIYLNRIALLQENFRNNCYTYTTNVAGGTVKDCTGLGYKANSPGGYYKLASNPVAGLFNQRTLTLDQAYRVSVAPAAGSPRPDDGMLGIDSVGAQGWDRNNNGTYDASENTWGK
ncbi:MAG TPA: hypothetical protein ENG78_05215 [Acidiferrobacteraceae bacterium]|nr:hypothetical protein [Acidiferrobacteraceae bacterium]HEX20201.1 hypothetical protein [Acidiferrobacteraceae bacterium]